MRQLVALSELVQLEPVVVSVDGREVAVVRVGDDVHAFSPRCTHRSAPLVEGAVTWRSRILCPWHLGTFDLRTGAVTAGPCREPLPIHPVAVIDGEVLLVTKGNDDA